MIDESDRTFENDERDEQIRAINERLLIGSLRHQELAETAMRTQQRLHDLVTGLDAVICELDIHTGKPTFLSSRMETFLGESLSNWRLQPDFLNEIIHPDEREQMCSFLHSIENSEYYEYEFRAKSANTESIWMRNRVHRVYDESGKCELLRCVIVDVTEQRKTAMELSLAYDRERHIAETLQRSLLFMPPENSFPGLAVSRRYEPASDEALVGGDFWDTFACDHGNVALILGDVMGHGLRAAVFTAELKYVLRGFVREHERPGRILKQMNEYLCESYRLFREGLNSEGDDAPLCLTVVIIDVETGSVWASSAGMNAPLLVLADSTVQSIDVNGLLLGIQAGEEYEEIDFQLQPGDSLILSTDGVTEAYKGNSFLGYDGFKRLVQESWPLGTLDEIGRKILDDTRAYGGGQLRDDACIVMARRVLERS